jgi:Ca2+/Na+ antiporter
MGISIILQQIYNLFTIIWYLNYKIILYIIFILHIIASVSHHNLKHEHYYYDFIFLVVLMFMLTSFLFYETLYVYDYDYDHG